MYRIAVITDIHGNIYALRSALEDIRRKKVDAIYCLGDMIGMGPFSNQVCETLFSHENVQLVTGNHDEAVMALIKGSVYPKSREKVKAHHQWIADRLTSEYKKAISRLSRFLTTNVAGWIFYFALT
ncbi:Calcineurin-like phosphoesterase superfamily domain-containing protein [Halobacillus karajensis]|uniref:Diadenosine tetraphosphatase n=1 Tax=Halobacillus karajensis TaxID=195088 RepID=A0A024P5C7_9BACI|nr:metallophosphoesterase family protein [Halobacillus karajensis]CDQ17818.1 diadenosine tetraphosphatase [Halobacillus karajensis]CDQ24224.1 diadenosine tetraphosphatase [Halobacillus karajensis]CDQ29527.1 diadenosine tetraphosphatase [Halobacillus karajensis]SEH63305.1 Calcineurin-like phosphoesterase superfamily domain-containing protein [Halobacillus karajensis]